MNSLPMCVRVPEAVAEVTGTDPKELPPLYDRIEPEALDTLVNSMPHGEVAFEYASCSVSVESNGAIQIDPLVSAD